MLDLDRKRDLGAAREYPDFLDEIGRCCDFDALGDTPYRRGRPVLEEHVGPLGITAAGSPLQAPDAGIAAMEGFRPPRGLGGGGRRRLDEVGSADAYPMQVRRVERHDDQFVL